MSHFAQIEKPDLLERCLARLSHILERAALRHAHYRVMQTSLTELRGLSAAELADLGLNRSMLRDVARQAADKQVAL